MSIPLSKPIPRKKYVPWWSREMMVLRTDKEIAWRNLCRKMTNENIIDYKRKNAIFNRTKKLPKPKHPHPHLFYGEITFTYWKWFIQFNFYY